MSLISVGDALALIARHAIITGTETISLEKAPGRIAAAPVKALITQPAAALSAMDGYAVKATDVAKAGTSLRVIGESAAGSPFRGKVASGETVRIFTGAVLPQGTDHIIIQENVTRDGDDIVYTQSDSAVRYVRPAGNDFHKGDLLFDIGQHIGPAQVLAAAAANHGRLTVFKRPRVAILANGNELKQAGDELTAGSTVNSCAPALYALFKNWECDVMDLGIASDDADDIARRIAKAQDADLIIPVGGASVGDHDYMHEAVAQLGFETIFSKVNVKPGKPTWFGRIKSASGKGQYVLGLPGNPASAYVCAHLFIPPLLNTGVTTKAAAKLAAPIPANGNRETYLRAIHTIDAGGQLHVTALPRQDSGLVTPFLSATCLIPRKASAQAVAAADSVDIVML